MGLAAYRKSQGLTQKDAARALGLRSKSLITMIERGDRHASPDLARRIEDWSKGELRARDLVSPRFRPLFVSTPSSADTAQGAAA